MRNDRSEESTSRAPGVAVVGKAIDLLACLGEGRALSVAELAATTRVTKTAAYRILNTLEERGWVVREEPVRRYSLGPSLLALGRSRHSSDDLTLVARPYMQALWEAFGETVNLGILSRRRILYVDMIESGQRLRTSSPLGSEDHLHSTALGKAVLACLPADEARALLLSVDRARRTPRTRVALDDLLGEVQASQARGYAIDDEENETGARCVAAGIIDGHGRPLGALSVSAPTLRFTAELMTHVGETVRGACLELSAAFGGPEARSGDAGGRLRA